MRHETLSKIYARSPEECLQAAMDRMTERAPYQYPNKDTAFLWQTTLGIDERTHYGSYQRITKKMLEGRSYKIEFWDGAPSIFWTDVLFDPKTSKRHPR